MVVSRSSGTGFKPNSPPDENRAEVELGFSVPYSCLKFVLPLRPLSLLFHLLPECVPMGWRESSDICWVEELHRDTDPRLWILACYTECTLLGPPNHRSSR